MQSGASKYRLSLDATFSDALTSAADDASLAPPNTRVSNSYDQPQLPPTKMAPTENGEFKQSRISSTSSNTNWHNHVLIQGSR